MTESKVYTIETGTELSFHNHMDFCIGTGRMGLALQKEYQDQLKLVQERIGFQHIRGHGLFCDDMAIYQEYTDAQGEVRVEYNYTYLDMVMDSYLKLGLRPFLELGFMPEKLASGDQTVFYWKGNVTPPKSYDQWCDMVQSLLRHLMKRYGAEDVVTWPVEVWNEPNLPGFWKDASKEEYFHLFERTFYAVKEVDQRFCVGGPAVCGGSDEEWIQAFLTYCSEKKIPVDFITRHHYTTEFPIREGHYGYAKLSQPEYGFSNLQTTRDIIESFEEFVGLPIHITEFNTSYIPNCPLHDTNQNAAYLAHQLSRLGDFADSYSYWTFGDIFEEQGVPFTPFHGGFGLVANGGIPKPTFWTFAFFKQLHGTCVHRSDDAVILQKEDGSYVGVAWNLSLERTGRCLELEYHLPLSNETKLYCLLTKTVDERVCNPLRVWHDMGEPAYPTSEQISLLKDASNPLVATQQLKAKDSYHFTLTLEENAVVYFELGQVTMHSDLGYDYNRVMKQENSREELESLHGENNL